LSLLFGRVVAIISLLFACAALCGGCTERLYTELHGDALVADMHSDVALRMVDGFDFSQRDSIGHIDLPRLAEGGVDLEVFACYLDTKTPRDSCRARVDLLLDTLDAQIARNRDRITVCRTAGEAERIIADGRVAAFLAIENGVAIAGDLSNLDHFYDRGVRYLTLTHTKSSDWCISSADTAPSFDGLTDFGWQVVRRMNELGMIIDISHAAPSVVRQVLELSEDPVIASHSCVHAICPHDRNLTDDQIRAIAERGGVIGINFYNGYISKAWDLAADPLWHEYEPRFKALDSLYPDRAERKAARRRLDNEINERLSDFPVNVDSVTAHIDHIVKLVGADHVGLGSDFDGIASLPAGLSDGSQLPNLTRALVERGYSEVAIRKILGGNFMRVFRQVCDR